MSYNNRELKKREMRRRMVPGEEDGDYMESLERKSRKRKNVRLAIILTAIIVLVVTAVTVFLLNRYYRYKEYEMTWEKELSEGSFVGYEKFGANVLKYSHDGATYYDLSGETVWVDSYEMNNPRAYVSGDFACIADVGGYTLVIYDLNGKLGTTTTLRPLTKAVISESGVVAAILDENDAAYITFYKKDGTPLDIEIKSLLSGDGYPVDIALAPSGSQLIAAYSYLSMGQLKSKVVFYDFSEVGKNIPNRLVAGFEEPFEESLIARVRFLNGVYSYALADTGITFFSSRNVASPELVKDLPTEAVIEQVFSCDRFLGVVYSGIPEAETPYRLVLYGPDGSEMLIRDFAFSFRNVSTDGEYIYFMDDDRLVILNCYGNIKYDGEFADSARVIRKGHLPGRFIFSGATYLREYSFK